MPSQVHPVDSSWPAQPAYEFKEWPKWDAASDGKPQVFESQAHKDQYEESLHPQKSKSKAGDDAKGKGGAQAEPASSSKKAGF